MLIDFIADDTTYTVDMTDELREQTLVLARLHGIRVAEAYDYEQYLRTDTHYWTGDEWLRSPNSPNLAEVVPTERTMLLILSWSLRGCPMP